MSVVGGLRGGLAICPSCLCVWLGWAGLCVFRQLPPHGMLPPSCIEAVWSSQQLQLATWP